MTLNFWGVCLNIFLKNNIGIPHNDPNCTFHIALCCKASSLGVGPEQDADDPEQDADDLEEDEDPGLEEEDDDPGLEEEGADDPEQDGLEEDDDPGLEEEDDDPGLEEDIEDTPDEELSWVEWTASFKLKPLISIVSSNISVCLDTDLTLTTATSFSSSSSSSSYVVREKILLLLFLAGFWGLRNVGWRDFRSAAVFGRLPGGHGERDGGGRGDGEEGEEKEFLAELMLLENP